MFFQRIDGFKKVDGGDGNRASHESWQKKEANYKCSKTYPTAHTALSKMCSILRISAKLLRWSVLKDLAMNRRQELAGHVGV